MSAARPSRAGVAVADKSVRHGPIAAQAASTPIVPMPCANAGRVGEHSSTFAGNPLACAAGSATIDSLTEDNLVSNSEIMGCIFKSGLLEIKEKYKIVREVRGLGMMLGI